MSKRFVPLLLICLAAAVPVCGQGFEFTPYIGWTFSEGVEVNALVVEGLTFDKITPVSGFNYGFQFDALVGEHLAIGFNFADQSSALEGTVRGEGKREFTDMNVRNYHVILTYNMGESDDAMRPYIFGGLGATQYSPDDIMGQNVEGNTNFSTTWGGGVKAYAGEHFGFRLGARWTPTFIRSDPAGLWCNPHFPGSCWVLTDDKYSHQFELSGGVIFRFGNN